MAGTTKRDKANQASTKRVEMAHLTQDEIEREARLTRESQRAFLGIGKIDIEGPHIYLETRRFNPTRQRQNDLINRICRMLQTRDNRSASNPLTVAIRRSEIDTDTLTESYDVIQHTPILSDVKIRVTKITPFVLAGYHRVAAARKAIEDSTSVLVDLEDRLDTVKSQAIEEDEDGNSIRRRDEETIRVLKAEIKFIKGTLAMIRSWPVRFYDIDELKRFGTKITPSDPEVLLRFLTENTTEPRATRTANDRLFDILKRNHHEPKGRDHWSLLANDNRAVQAVTGRESVWTMSTEAVRLSEALFASWVTRASDIKEASKHPAFRILTTIATHMIKRTTTLFAPAPPRNKDKGALTDAMKTNRKWTVAKDKLLQEWKEKRSGFKTTSNKVYINGRLSLLGGLVVAGQDAHKFNETIDQTFRVTDRVIKSTRKAGITTDFDSYHSYVHVDSDLMKRLDKIYRQHFQEDDGVTLLQCFNVIGDDRCKDRLTEYIAKVEKELEETLLRLDAKGSHEEGDPHRHGVRGAGIDLKTVFAIADGRLCLPLATVSMLDDLKKFVLADENIIVEVARWFDGLASHIMEIKGQDQSAHVWSDVIAIKLGKMCPLDKRGGDRLMLTVSRIIMAHTTHFSTISGEIIGCIPPQSKSEMDGRSKASDVLKEATLLHKAIREAGELSKIKTAPNASPHWALLLNTSWTSLNMPKLEQLKKICAVSLEESSAAVLEARGKALLSKRTMDLRFDLWLNINLWIGWQGPGFSLFDHSKKFQYWDGCQDEVEDLQGPYRGEMAEQVNKLMIEDAKNLKNLGDFLTRCPSLSNNRNDGPSQRVISIEAKAAIDELLEFASGSMDQQRLLRFPPAPEFKHMPNPFSKLPAYRHSQLTFKTFSDEEIKNQAGADVLPELDPVKAKKEGEVTSGTSPSGMRSRQRDDMDVDGQGGVGVRSRNLRNQGGGSQTLGRGRGQPDGQRNRGSDNRTLSSTNSGGPSSAHQKHLQSVKKGKMRAVEGNATADEVIEEDDPMTEGRFIPKDKPRRDDQLDNDDHPGGDDDPQNDKELQNDDKAQNDELEYCDEPQNDDKEDEVQYCDETHKDSCSSSEDEPEDYDEAQNDGYFGSQDKPRKNTDDSSSEDKDIMGESSSDDVFHGMSEQEVFLGVKPAFGGGTARADDISMLTEAPPPGQPRRRGDEPPSSRESSRSGNSRQRGEEGGASRDEYRPRKRGRVEGPGIYREDGKGVIRARVEAREKGNDAVGTSTEVADATEGGGAINRRSGVTGLSRVSAGEPVVDKRGKGISGLEGNNASAGRGISEEVTSRRWSKRRDITGDYRDDAGFEGERGMEGGTDGEINSIS